jgi:monoamine oxidase
MGTNAKVLLQFDRPFFTGFGDWSGSLNRADAPLFGTWESGSTDGEAQTGLLTVYSGGRVGAGYGPSSPHGVAPEQVVADTLAALAEAVPEVSDAYNGRAWLDSWVDSNWARGSYAAFGPGQTHRYWGTLGEAQGTVHLAGEQTSTHSQGYLNGGVESGCRVAAEILEATGIPLAPGLARIRRAEQEEA